MKKILKYILDCIILLRQVLDELDKLADDWRVNRLFKSVSTYFEALKRQGDWEARFPGLKPFSDRAGLISNGFAMILMLCVTYVIACSPIWFSIPPGVLFDPENFVVYILASVAAFEASLYFSRRTLANVDCLRSGL